MPTIQLKDISIHYLKEGSGPPLVLLHGMGNNAKSWIHQMEYFKNHYTVIAWDAPGYGNSSDPNEVFQNFSQFTDCLKQFLDQLNLDKIFLLGHSMGAAVAIDFATRFPNIVDKLVIAAPTRGSAGLTEEENVKKRNQRHHLIDYTSSDEIARTRVPSLLSPSASESVTKYAEEIMSEVRPAGYKSVSNSLFHLNQMDDYSKILMPTLIICGNDDQVTPVSESEIIVQNITNGKLEIIQKAGHLCYMERRDAFNQCLSEFLNTK
ncbi:alpha/beta fold hydrolase [Alteribacillus bidgolensis]|uniref:Pimeloyl-ACP methyl ester carboxylesterase n=1 Tax=Alteribacillus bidgolensis TaxID=930129 RepID=A0A1G8FPF9_9BACI|nr:alpha/beta hydrolase [Alteribacillus bidgolensis]SDH84020.1 Pimeloyl-ACP methyl ester carboxylesterase [Alteribacillus bidgolensis]